MILIKRKKEMGCPEDYTECKYYHPELNTESRCIKDSKISFCIEELRAWIKVNKQFSDKIKEKEV